MNETEPVQTPRPAKARKEIRLFKRDDAGSILSPDAPGWRERVYYFQIQVRGIRYLRCTQTNDKSQALIIARARAAEIRENVVRGDLNKIKSARLRQTASAPVEQLITAYLGSAETTSQDGREQTIHRGAAPVDAKPSTRRNNVSAFRLLLADAFPSVAGLTASQLDGAAARRAFAKRAEAAQAIPDQGMQASFKRTTNSRFIQTGCLFMPKALAHYKDLGLYHPALEDFAAAIKDCKFGRIALPDYNAPADEVVASTLKAWEAIEHRDIFLAVGHELAFGLRAGEMAQAKWGWWTTRQGYPVLDGTAEVKNGSGLVQVRALDPFFNILRGRVDTRGWRGQPADYILSGSPTYRGNTIFRLVGQFLREQGWKTKKTNHALRAYAGCQIAMKYGIYEAQGWLRHSTVRVTEQHYSHFVRKFKPADVDSLAARWATSAGAPTLTVLPAASEA